MNTLEKINEIFKDVLEIDTLNITRETSSNDIDEWDSLNHIHLVVAIEKYFNLKFSTSQVLSWKNVGEMCDSINNLKSK